MNSPTTRRSFLKRSLVISSALTTAPALLLSDSGNDTNIPLIDYHVHLTRSFDIKQAVELAEKRNMKFGILEHPGRNYAIRTNDHLKQYISRLRQFEVYVGLQPVYLNWARDFSQDLINQLDYVLMDADTIPQKDGSYMRIWQNEHFIDDMEAFMDTYMNHIIQILTNEPINIFGRPTYLPINFARNYNEIWTRERMMMIIDLAKKRNIALEIQENIRIPSMEFIKLAKKAGLKFTFGTNARNPNAGHFHYCIEMAKECSFTEDDIFSIKKK